MTRERPRFSIVTPVYAPPIDVLRETIDSVRAQTFTDWELILVDDVSPDPAVRDALRAAAAADARITVIERAVNGHIVKASNDGVEAARGEFIALLDHDDLLTPDALEKMSEAIDEHPEADYLYSDEDKLDDEGRYYDEFRKPAWSPERLRAQMYTCHFSVLRTSLVREVGGFHEGFDGSQDHDLVLRVSERSREVVHVPEILYHWRVVPGSAAGDQDAKPYAWVAGRKAVQEHVDRVGIDAEVVFGSITGTYHLRRRLDPETLVSVIIPTRGGAGLVWGERRVFVVEAVRSLIARGGHENLEIVVVYDGVTPPEVLDELRALAGDRLLLVRYDLPFNYSEKCNLGVLASHGSAIVLLNDDIEVVSEDFVAQLVAPIFEDGVGLTGARLHYSDGTIQHAGLAFYEDHLIHLFLQASPNDPGPFAALTVNREVSGLTAACVALRRTTFDQVGGLTETLPANFNDVDLSAKISSAGLRLVWLAGVEAYHFESQTREPVVQAWEHDIIKKRWNHPDVDKFLPVY